jgi:MoCo/4Fe-4S cofactor protein with predicted Tat translocation signal
MLDACPHHHEDQTPPEATGADALDGVNLREPRNSAPTKKRFWRSMDELAGTPAFEQMLHREFPHAAAEWTDEPSRRHFMKLMGASLALAGLSACTLKKTQEAVVPYVVPPEEVIPGRPLFFASTAPWMGYGKGVVVESHEGRPTKVEGNRDHPSSLGAADIWVQASILEMYDPDRSQTVKHGNDTSTWGNFTTDLSAVLAKAKVDGGEGLRFLTGTVTSPTVARLMADILEQYPKARWHQHEPFGRRNGRAAAVSTFGKDVEPVYSFEKANVILALDSNFLVDLPGSMAYANAFIAGRRIRDNTTLTMNRLYAAEPSVTLTGARADHRLPLKGTEVEQLARDVAAAVNGTKATGKNAAWVNAVAADLVAAKGAGLVIAGETQPPAVHALAYALNDALGNVGPDKPVRYINPVEAYGKGGPLTLEQLLEDVDHGDVDLLVVMGTNPCFTAPYAGPPGESLRAGLVAPTPDDRKGDFETKNPLHKVGMIVHHGLYGAEVDETAAFAHWHIPASHYLESWGDLRGHDGTASIVQPLIEPLYSSKSDVELLAFLAGHGTVGAYDLIKSTWDGMYKRAGNAVDPFETYWEKSVEKGVFLGSDHKPQDVTAQVKVADLIARPPSTQPSTNGLELCFRPDPNVWDGRFANLSWLQELPKPVTLLTWDTAALMSVNTAKRLGVENADQGRGLETQIVKVTYQSRELAVPALVMPGHADDSITIYTGYGRVRGGHVTQQASGSDAFYLRPDTNAWAISGVGVEKQDDTYLLATAQSHHLIDIPTGEKSRLDEYWLKDRELIHTYQIGELTGRAPTTAPAYRKVSLKIDMDRIPHKEEVLSEETLLPAWKYEWNKWGMVIDNQACIGCNACVTACQSENNIAVVGKDMVLKGRIMLWLRIDTYFDGESHGTPNVYFQPIPCMHCENAPCTLVCPVEATTVSAEGINEMTYNRCVGTRYCSNNCPYKVRRFNFLQWTDYETPQFMLQRNPNVTVRSRGVMEKCNYCVQRINNGRIEAKKLDRPIDPGEVITACAQACPTQAIAFGNLNDPRWEVTKLQAEPLRYTLLDELNTLPRTSYLPRVSNPSPALPTDVGRSEYNGPAEDEPARPAKGLS